MNKIRLTSDKQIGLQIQKNFYSTLKDFMYAMAKDCKVDTGGLDTPLYVFSSKIYSKVLFINNLYTLILTSSLMILCLGRMTQILQTLSLQAFCCRN